MHIEATMPAAVYRRCGPASEVISIERMATPEPGVGEVLVAVAMSGVNPHDTKKRAGWLTTQLPAEVIIPHSDGAGIIVAVGPGVSAARLQKRVWLHGADHARPGSGAGAGFVVVGDDHAHELPVPAGFDAGACLGVPALTAHRAVFADGPVHGQSILVTGGAGAVAGYAIQLAVLGGAYVIATASTPAKKALAASYGASLVIDYRTDDVAAAVLAATGGQGVDRIIEVDFGANLDVCHRVIKPNGVVAAYSSTRVREPVLPYYAFARKAVTLHFIQGMLLTPAMVSAAVAMLTPLLANGHLTHKIAARFAFADIAKAHALLESGEALGKVLVEGPDSELLK
jgi:NADPH:quinone reductase